MIVVFKAENKIFASSANRSKPCFALKIVDKRVPKERYVYLMWRSFICELSRKVAAAAPCAAGHRAWEPGLLFVPG